MFPVRLCRGVFYGVSLFSFACGMNALQFIALPFLVCSKRLSYEFNSHIAGTIWSVMQRIFRCRYKGRITYSGDSLPDGESAIVISNHVSTTDVYLIHSVAQAKGMLPYCKYFAKDSLKYIPFFGWGMWIMGMLFIKRNWMKDQTRIMNTFARFKAISAPVWVVSFLEGSRISASKLAKAQVFAAERGLHVPRNILVPRTKGFVATVQALRDSHVKYVYDLTLAYWNKVRGFCAAPGMVGVHTQCLDDYKFHVHIRRFLISELPEDEEKLSEWVRQIYQEKDDYLDELKTNWEASEFRLKP
ncbi:1-acylglycerol-3-phosphate acyltransferase [Basidiobolus meristosporus CBS 931.73]|uniref:1-acylglycerol-3-phosphate acyltransferase n=1 Tax=Basidiobolus meristosporus CBS 931.73 TaxID=1314790 RepID=A0A1Y1Z577_9FUNG|nr:1-acylglycerol-3-phosphate acyltransferase [Basidiobolus meristosporus CBS 931.73]|eukprot:ORY05421.1 1-acylglycerol-3-phosphate acyltransferase [Basidiobolus meristosporus CBS 931.73]